MKSVTKKKNILLLTFVFSPNIGGVESHLDDLTTYLARVGHQVTVLTYKSFGMRDRPPFKEIKKNLTIIRIPWFHPAIFNILEKIPFIEVLYLVPPILLYSGYHLLRNSRQIDVIQVHGFNMAIVGAILSKIFRKPLVINTHVSFYFIKESLYARLLHFFLQQARSILVLTQESKDELIKIGMDTEKVVVYHQWIDEKTFNPKGKLKSRQKLKIAAQKFAVLFVGRFSPAKGITILLDAAEKLNKNIELVFVGSGPLDVAIKKKSAETDTVKFVGRVPYADLPYYYSAANIVTIPSTPATDTYSEGIPRVMIEAYRCSTPVVATRAGGVKEHVTPLTGFTIQPNAADIAKTINKLSRKRQLLEKLGDQAHQYAIREFSLLVNAKIIEESLV